MINTYLALCERLKGRVTALRIIDLYRGQLLSAATPTDLPAVYLSISYPSTDEIDGDTQICNMTIVVRLVFAGDAIETSSITPAEWRAQSLVTLNVIDSVDAALQGFGCAEFSSLSRQSITPEERSDGLMVYNLTYTTSFEEQY
ncbi:MAG: hypothetical protein RSC11_07790 [Mucinivorans sp.]